VASDRDRRINPSTAWSFRQWLVPAVLFLVVIGAIGLFRSFVHPRLSGPELAEIAVNTQQQYSEGHIGLDFTSQSQQSLNQWFKRNLDYPLALPASPEVPGDSRPYRLQGASLVKVAGRKVAFVTYNMQPGPTSLMVTPASLATASGGVEAQFKKVTFHYSSVRGYKVVTWSQHGLTYALVSHEGNKTQKSCMICHSSMRDRDLSQTPAPLRD
jgi:anti-sigma factor RsiW